MQPLHGGSVGFPSLLKYPNHSPYFLSEKYLNEYSVNFSNQSAYFCLLFILNNNKDATIHSLCGHHNFISCSYASTGLFSASLKYTIPWYLLSHPHSIALSNTVSANFINSSSFLYIASCNKNNEHSKSCPGLIILPSAVSLIYSLLMD